MPLFHLPKIGSMTTDFVYMGFPKRTFDGSASYGFDGNSIQLFSTAYICPRCYNRTSEIPTQCCVCKVQLNSSSHIARSHHHLFPVSNFDEIAIVSSSLSSINSNNDSNNNNDNNHDNNNNKKSSKNIDIKEKKDENKVIEENVLVAYRINEIIFAKSLGSDSVINDVDKSTKIEVEYLEKDFIGIISCCKGCFEEFNISSLVMQCPSCDNLFCIECDLFIHNSLHNCPGCL